MINIKFVIECPDHIGKFCYNSKIPNLNWILLEDNTLARSLV